jgi:hypothetical protein
MSTAPTPVHANVAFLRIPRFATLPVAEQAALKEQLESSARAAISMIPADARAVLDAEDGLAIVFFGEPAQALDIAEALHAGASQAPLQAGLNHGPLALSSRGADARVFGDGLTAAAAAARFAPAGKLLVTHDFAKALEMRDPARAAGLATAGDFTDTRVRLHSFYTPDAALGVRHRRRLLAYGVGGVAAILLLGIAGREAARRLFPPLPAVVRFSVRPRGEIFVDGVARGVTPPLRDVEVEAGHRVVQVRNAGFATLEIALDLKPGEHTTITHVFARPAPPKQDLWRDFKKKFGGS